MDGNGDGDFLENARSRHADHGNRFVVGIALVLAVVAFATAPIVPLLDPDEGYYPATAAESLRAGEFWDLRFNNAPRWDKPILSYALIAAAFAAFGESELAARLPSAIEGAVLRSHACRHWPWSSVCGWRTHSRAILRQRHRGGTPPRRLPRVHSCSSPPRSLRASC